MGGQQLLTMEGLSALADRRARDDCGHYLVEGVRFVARALETGRVFAGLVICRDLLRSPMAPEFGPC